MDYQVIQIDRHTWRIEEPGVRFFLLEGAERALLIDSGMQVRNAREIAEGLTALPVSLLVTHGDRDHVGSNEEFPVFYMHPAEASNYYNTQGKTGEFLPVWDGETLDLGGRSLEIIALPGHTPGSIAVLDVKNRRLFGGDPVQDGMIFMFGIQREMRAYRHSLKRLEGYMDRFDEIYPSHGTCPISPNMIGKLYDASGDVLEGKVPGEEGERFGQKIMVYDVGIARFLCDRK